MRTYKPDEDMSFELRSFEHNYLILRNKDKQNSQIFQT